jgi:hypothetical protein
VEIVEHGLAPRFEEAIRPSGSSRSSDTVLRLPGYRVQPRPSKYRFVTRALLQVWPI